MKRMYPLFLVLLLASCEIEKPQNKSARVYIRSGGKVDSTYILDADGTISQSSTRDKSGRTVTRSYEYDGQRKLQSVARSVGSGASKVTYYSDGTQSDGSGRATGTSRTVVDPDGGSEQSDIRYLYYADGKLIAVALTDAKGNVQIKTLHDGGIKP